MKWCFALRTSGRKKRRIIILESSSIISTKLVRWLDRKIDFLESSSLAFISTAGSKD